MINLNFFIFIFNKLILFKLIKIKFYIKMKNKNLNNILILNKKFHLFMNNNKSTLESIKTTINSNIKPEEKLLSTNNKKKSIPSLILIKK